MIRGERLTLRVGRRTLLSEATFSIERGEFVAVLGPNGVGKSTLLRTLAGVVRPASGDVMYNETSVFAWPAPRRAREIALVAADDVFLDALTVRDVVAMGRYAHHAWWQWREHPTDVAAIDAALEAVSMASLKDRAFATLSSGERQRIWIALALAQAAPVLLLDEPTSHLDVRVAHEILALLAAQRRAGKTVVCVLHDPNEAMEFADRVMLLGCGQVLALQAPGDVFATNLPERAYGIAMQTVQTPAGLRVFARHHG